MCEENLSHPHLYKSSLTKLYLKWLLQDFALTLYMLSTDGAQTLWEGLESLEILCYIHQV